MSEDALLHVRVWVCEWLSVTVFRGKNIITKPESCLRDRQNIHKKKKKKEKKKNGGRFATPAAVCAGVHRSRRVRNYSEWIPPGQNEASSAADLVPHSQPFRGAEYYHTVVVFPL